MTTTIERPVLLLDIDGVLNLFPRFTIQGGAVIDRVTRQTDRHRVRLDETQKSTYLLNIPADARSLVTQLAEHFDVHWYTMWNDAADAVFAPLAGLPSFPYFECDWVDGREAFEKIWSPAWMRKYIWIAKTPLIPRYVGARPFLWIDDDTGPVDTLWLRDHPVVGEFNIITVEPHSGLTQAVVDEAIEWARSLTIKEDIAS